ncbi:hypothetical protein tinsulaeT_09230 [Thalassotalea insulae]|uniref:Uncharacterized protein n=1 Tax=Thalassotalea insulae TaxID=2056778 RepID=A0ABQ6GNM5_9GAMM|nr:hypothetical protein [Thalassotalea insulae]GLX77583.1 hypothetical protein tinsulaeT_09230 [Thalassotalea insulae]
MIKSKEQVYFLVAGVFLGIISTIVNFTMLRVEEVKEDSNLLANDNNLLISQYLVSHSDIKMDKLLALFGLNKAPKKQLPEDGGLLLSENITVRIVAQAKIKNELHTILEAVSPKEVKYFTVKVGTVIEGMTIKNISSKQLVVEHKNEQYIVKIFHPKELNLNKIESNNDIQ